MNTKRKIDYLVDETLESVSNIAPVKPSAFFKENVLRKMNEKQPTKANEVFYLDWFTPKYQAAALVCFVCLNTVVLLSSISDNYSENVDSFAEVYGLTETDLEGYLYQN